MPFNLPPSWDPGYALPDNVKDEGLERRAFVTKQMPRGTYVSGIESDGADLFYCGGGSSGKVRAVRRPTAQRPTVRRPAGEKR